MDYPQTIKNINSLSEYRFKEKGSLFIGTAIPLTNEEEAINKLSELRKKYYDATHNCYAYNLCCGKSKYSDDGEPNGTAGIRIFNAINHFELTDLILIVTRYFGGVKLGVGPLGKAYHDCAYNLLSQTERVEKILYRRIKIEYPFEFSNFVHRTLTKYFAKIENNLFAECPQIIAILPDKDSNKIYEEIKSLSNAKIKTEITDDRVYI